MNTFTKSLAIGLAFILTACTTNPYTGERQASKAAIYGAGAAAVCGIIGARESGKHARNAALGCGAIGAGIGAYMDVQEAKLKEQLQGSGVSVIREGNNIRLVMPGNITFETDKAQLRSSFYSVLDSVSLVLAKYNDTTMRVTGHTDNAGSEHYNQQLSEQRARSVANYLASRGVENQRMFVEGMGESQPIADNTSPQGRASNRRVELYILPKAG
jgi:outer membrane protein OmpA-like peptidoglycan-associated protein